MERGNLYFCIGLPRSSKSTYCDEWVAQAWETPRVIVSGDDFRTALHGMKFLPEAEGFVFAAMDVAIRALLARGFDVIVDETSTTEETIWRYLRIDLNATAVWIETSAEVCKERAIAAGKAYLCGPIDRMDAQMTCLKENWRKIIDEIQSYVKMRLEQDKAI